VIELPFPFEERTEHENDPSVSLRLVPPAEVSRALLLLCVATGALVSIATKGNVSGFAGGVAVGAGVALLSSRRRTGREAGSPPAEEDSA